MTMLARYPSKKDLKAAVGQPLRYTETSVFGKEYTPDGQFVVAGRKALDSQIKSDYFATVTMKDGLIAKVT